MSNVARVRERTASREEVEEDIRRGREARARITREPLPVSLSEAFETWIKQVECAAVTKLAHFDYIRALLRYFGDRPIADFAGKPGGELVSGFIRDEMGGRDRGLRERFSGTGNLAHHLPYNTVRIRLNTLRHALEHAIKLGALVSMPEPWPIPPRGCHGQLAASRWLLRPALEAAIAREPKKKGRLPAMTTKCETPIGPVEPGVVTLGETLDWFLKYGDRKAAAATRVAHNEHVKLLKGFFGADRPVAQFNSTSGYRLLLDFVEKEGPDEGGRGVKFTTCKKRLNTLRVALNEAVRRGDLEVLPPFPDLPYDSKPGERYLTVAEYRSIRATISPPWDLWFTVGVWTGQHTSDISSMTWAMVDLGQGPGKGPGPGQAFWLRRNSKNKKKPIWLPMPDELRGALTEAFGRNPPDAPDLPIVSCPPNNIRKHMRRACRILGIPIVTPIDLRRTCATWWIERGGPKDALRRWLGHAVNSQMVERHYSQITPDMVAGGVDALNRAGRDVGQADAPEPHPPQLRLLQATSAAADDGVAKGGL